MMQPCTLENIAAGDQVSVDGWAGIVVFCSVTDSYDDDFPRSDWPKENYAGLMVRHSGDTLVLHPIDLFAGEAGLSLEREMLSPDTA